MHEASLVAAMAEEIRRLAVAEGAQKVTRILVRIGEAAGVELEAFDFAFLALKAQDPLFSEAHLEIETRPVVLECFFCGHRQEGELGRPCDQCGQIGLQLISGDEIYLASIDLITGDKNV
ncbi:hydrogenase maturation nickel metallochaperone HypA [Thermosulfuriphilus ammonigenes]|uniref:Hydrogenase maturation factor HypA n=1 Tax=Thermosulfuriphilus ammonigenes TaxID=1936021 RepID=A0A6G7PVQ3_9BACT|nr:hydrogenase maturation nickel metallochaperone HypA [Thermosulfuriphilus ammonigenes]MBA2848124.1 hydrogenase nickel incorporation protein HypA/HybF [Thermosulfuriphilus ammonigenes]QIJ71700.1 hydrogenase maturation nickel metallochaperone HypA [Thermosulfuriphilus ammonigenes]